MGYETFPGTFINAELDSFKRQLPIQDAEKGGRIEAPITLEHIPKEHAGHKLCRDLSDHIGTPGSQFYINHNGHIVKGSRLVGSLQNTVPESLLARLFASITCNMACSPPRSHSGILNPEKEILMAPLSPCFVYLCWSVRVLRVDKRWFVKAREIPEAPFRSRPIGILCH